MEESHHNQEYFLNPFMVFTSRRPYIWLEQYLSSIVARELETPDTSCREVALEGKECHVIRLDRGIEWISKQEDPLVDQTKTSWTSTVFIVCSWKRREQSQYVVSDFDILSQPGKVIKPRERLHLEGTRYTNRPDSLYNTSSAANRRSDATEAPPQGQGIDVWDLNGLEPQEPAYNASRGGGIPFDIKQENEDLRKIINCIVCIDKQRCVVFLPCGHMALCWDCAVKVQKKCPICQGNILDRKIALFS